MLFVKSILEIFNENKCQNLKLTMILNNKLIILFHLYVGIHINCVNGKSCFDNSSTSDCTCSTGTSGAIGICDCISFSVRQGQPCAYDSVNGVDSVSSRKVFETKIALT